MKPIELLNQAKALLEKTYPSDFPYEPLISVERQIEDVAQLKNCVKYEQFFFVVNLAKRSIEFQHGLEDWLGYNSTQFDFFKYFSTIHPRHLSSLNSLAGSAFSVANSGNYQVAYMNHRVVIQIPLKHKNGNYLLFKRTLYPFQIDKSGKVTSYLNHFVLLRDYEESDSLDMRIALNQRVVSGSENVEVQETKKKNIAEIDLLPFSKTEIRILELFIENPSLTNSEVAFKIGHKETTMRKTHNSRILNKARDFFGIEGFKETKDVAKYLHKEGLL
jgi:hypothetical protein